MPFGPGRYDDLCTYVREAAEAGGAIVIVLNGKRGMGFSVQAQPEMTKALPQLLRTVADAIEKDTQPNNTSTPLT